MAFLGQSKEWLEFLTDRFNQLISREPVSFSQITPSHIPKVSGVYLITGIEQGNEIAYYVGRSKNLKQRIYNNHLMGPITNARLKRYLIGAGVCHDLVEAKDFIKKNCQVRWIEENDIRTRGAIEGYVTGLVFPKYGIYEEH